MGGAMTIEWHPVDFVLVPDITDDVDIAVPEVERLASLAVQVGCLQCLRLVNIASSFRSGKVFAITLQ